MVENERMREACFNPLVHTFLENGKSKKWGDTRLSPEEEDAAGQV